MFAASSTRTILVGVVFPLLNLVRHDASVLTGALVDLAFIPMPLHLCLELIAASAQLSDSLLREELLQGPFFDILLLILLQLCDELNGALEDGSLVLLAARDNLGEFVDAFVDSLATSTLNYILSQLIVATCTKMVISPSLWLSLRTLCHSSEPTWGLWPPVFGGESLGAA
jgi:hypothetical protein